MDSVLVLLSASLVGYKIFASKNLRNAERSGVIPPPLETDVVEPDALQSVGVSQPPPLAPGADVQAFLVNTRPSTMSLPQIAEAGPKRLQAAEDDGNGVQQFSEQFFPQDSKSTGRSVSRSPWMRAVETSQSAPPRTEREAEHPSERHDRDDVRGTAIPAVLREREAQRAAQTISRFKKFESPVEAEWTSNGEKRGLHPSKRYHKFVLNDEPVVELPEGPRGGFSGASRSSRGADLDNNRRELHVQQTGIPTASFKVGIPESSCELDASNAEGWQIDTHVASAARAPVDAGNNSTLIKQSFTLAHDEALDVMAVSDGCNLSRANLTLGAADPGGNAGLVKQSFSLAHEENIDLLTVINYSARSKTHMPSSSSELADRCARMKESFRLPYDGALDVQAVTKYCNQARGHLPPGEAIPVAHMQTSEKGVATPSVVGAKGGVRQKHTDKSAEVKSVARKENLAASAQALSVAAGAKASRPSAASRAADHEHTEASFAEEDGSSNRRGGPLRRKAVDTSKFDARSGPNQFSLGNSRDQINDKPFTSRNFAAPRATNVPSFLSVAPTASLSLSQKQVSLKQPTDGLADMVSMGRNRGVSRVKTTNLSEKKPEKRETKLRSVVLDRTNRGVVVANPYSRPRPVIQ